MQRLINTLAVISFVMSGAVVGTGVVVVLNKDMIVEKVKAEAIKSVKELLGTSQLGSVLVDGITPDAGVTDEALGVEGNPLVEIPTIPF